MSGLPVVLELEGRRCLVIGGGAGGRRKIETLLRAGASLVLITPEAGPYPGVTHLRRRWQPGDGKGFLLVVTATGDPEVDEAAATDAHAHGALVLRADHPERGDLRFPAVHRSGRVTVAVDTGGADPTLAAALRDRIARVEAGKWAELARWASENRPVSPAEARRRIDEVTG